MHLIDELEWRGMLHDFMPGTREQLDKEMTTGYVGFDPTSDSLHIGNLVTIMLLKHLQLAGHRPITLIGGATGMIGDPSGKSDERVLMAEEQLRTNESAIRKQLEKFLDFTKVKNGAQMVNNYDWMKDYNFLSFVRDVGKHITVNYMMAKDSVKKRLETGISFTEFTYQLVQGYDFLYLFENYNCKLQMGGSDQWGNILTGTELIRRKFNGEAFALTAPLITKADGGKFGKTEEGNVWLDPLRTSPYKFYQFWLNSADKDAENYIKIFTLLPKETITEIITEHNKNPHLRLLQKEIAKDVTSRVHSVGDYQKSVEASDILFGKGNENKLFNIDPETLLSAFEGVPQYSLERTLLENGLNIIDLLAIHTKICSSRSEAKRVIEGGGISVNKLKINSVETMINHSNLIHESIILIQTGKKNYHIVNIQ
jgi:tyrosyl-tRNA synthetase